MIFCINLVLWYFLIKQSSNRSLAFPKLKFRCLSLSLSCHFYEYLIVLDLSIWLYLIFPPSDPADFFRLMTINTRSFTQILTWTRTHGVNCVDHGQQIFNIQSYLLTLADFIYLPLPPRFFFFAIRRSTLPSYFASLCWFMADFTLCRIFFCFPISFDFSQSFSLN